MLRTDDPLNDTEECPMKIDKLLYAAGFTLMAATMTSGTAFAASTACPDKPANTSASAEPGAAGAGAGAGGAAGAGAEQHAGISKDGSLAPLEGANAADATGYQDGQNQQTATTANDGADTMGGGAVESTGSVSKDGQTMPLANEQGGGDDQVAMSGQDAAAQQHGDAAAAKATDCD